jgi:cobalt/nickel transport system ATP-binding protein
VIEAVDLAYRHPDGALALDRVSFSLGRGEKAVLIGSNGSGKTTLMRLLDGLLFPETGVVRYEGTALTAKSLGQAAFHRRFRGEVAFLFQNPDAMLFHPTVFEEIAFGPRQLGLDDVDRRVHRWAEDLQVGHLLSRTPFRLSSGEKQKVCLAALLAVEPRLLLLDEPTANLDPRSSGWMVDFLQDLELTVLVTTHNLSLAPELGSRCLVLGEDHTLIHDGAIAPVLQDLDLLQRANLVHSHRHRHGDVEHRHPHTHDWG